MSKKREEKLLYLDPGKHAGLGKEGKEQTATPEKVKTNE